MIVFVAAPLRAPDPYTVGWNIGCAQSRYARHVLMSGHTPLVPHGFAHALAAGDPDEDAIGRAAALRLLRLADELWAFREPTEGMRVEIAAAVKAGKRVRYFNDECEEVSHG